MHKFHHYKGFKIFVGVLSIGWLGLLTWQVSPNDLLGTSIFEADGTVVGFELSDEDLKKITQLKEKWSDEEVKSNAHFRAQKAVSAYNAGDFENAIELYNEALALGDFDDENRITLLSNLALAYEANRYTENAIQTYTVIQDKTQPSSALYLVTEGKIALLQEYIDVKKAIHSFNSALKLEPSNFDANNTLALIYMGEYGSEFIDYKKALTYNQTMTNIFPNNFNVRINLAMNYVEMKLYVKAQDELRYVIEARPQSLPANYLMMKTLNLTGNTIEAKKYANQLTQWYVGFKEDKLVAEVLGN